MVARFKWATNPFFQIVEQSMKQDTKKVNIGFEPILQNYKLLRPTIGLIYF